MADSPREIVRRRTQALVPFAPKSPASTPETKVKGYDEVFCEKCGSDNHVSELLLCDKCDRGFHLFCLTPKQFDVPKGSWFCPSCSDQISMIPKDIRKKQKRKRSVSTFKKRERLLPFNPSKELTRRIIQRTSLLSALEKSGAQYSNELTYPLNMAPRSANCATLECKGMQVLPKEDIEILNLCKTMMGKWVCPPLMVSSNLVEGFVVKADEHIKCLTIITEYVGDVDYLCNRVNDDGNCMMDLLRVVDPSKDLVICPQKSSNIARFISGINNHTRGGKKANVKSVIYNVNGEARALIVACKYIRKGEQLYMDYNGCYNNYPTKNFV